MNAISSTSNKAWINPWSKSYTLEEKLFFLLRFGALGCFVGHGFWGLMSKKAWLPFFEVFYIPQDIAYPLMPVIGSMDILLGLLIFFRPNRAMILWAAFWTLFTAQLRPSAGMGMSEFFERAGNYGIPIALLLLAGLPSAGENWWTRIRSIGQISASRHKYISWVLRLSIFLLLAGHGGLAFFMNHQGLLKNLNSIGLHFDTLQYQIFGLFEIALAFVVLVNPRIPGLLGFVLVYKLVTELLHPLAGLPRDIFETIERMGDYIAPVTLIVIYQWERENQNTAADRDDRSRADLSGYPE